MVILFICFEENSYLFIIVYRFAFSVFWNIFDCIVYEVFCSDE